MIVSVSVVGSCAYAADRHSKNADISAAQPRGHSWNLAGSGKCLPLFGYAALAWAPLLKMALARVQPKLIRYPTQWSAYADKVQCNAPSVAATCSAPFLCIV